jgi:hypothetical protein
LSAIREKHGVVCVWEKGVLERYGSVTVGSTVKKRSVFCASEKDVLKKYRSRTTVHGTEKTWSSRDTGQKTKIPPPMTPKRTAHPVANILAKRPAPPLLLIEPRLVGDGELEDLLLVREDQDEEEEDQTLEGQLLDGTEDMLGGGQVQDGVTLDDELEVRGGGTEEELEERDGGVEEEVDVVEEEVDVVEEERLGEGEEPQMAVRSDSASVRSEGIHPD